MKDPSGDNLLLGKGKVYFDRFDDGDPTGERFLGNCTSLEMSHTDELKEKYSSCSPSSPLLKSVNIRRTMEFTLVLDEFSKENVALALMGTNTVLAQGAGGPVSPHQDVVGVKQGCFYDLGKRNIKSVAVKKSGGTPTYVVDEDYTVDAVSGRIYIVPAGDITDGYDLEVTYSWDADTSPVIRAGVSNVIEGFLRFIGDPACGPAYEVQVWKVSVTRDGAIGLISDDYANFTLKGKVLDDSVNHEDEPYFLAIQVSA
jgi:hypothetical protein